MAPIRILVADSSAVARRELSQLLGDEPELEIAALTPTGRMTLEQVEKLRPEVVVLELALQDKGLIEKDGWMVPPPPRRESPSKPSTPGRKARTRRSRKR